MNINECANLQYDISLNYFDLEEPKVFKWYWDINGGYSSCGAKHGYDTPQEALNELNEFLKTFKGFDK